MTAFITWYLLLTILGWLTFPLAYALFPALADRGYTLSRAIGLLIWGYIFWLLASLGIAQNDIGGILLALALLIGLSVFSITNHGLDKIRVRTSPDSQQTEHAARNTSLDFLKQNKSLVIATEILFLAAFAFLAFVRSANPELNGTERPMELAFINGILRSPTFPPQDPWLSGYAISYYYFGYVMTAMLARISGIPGSLAHNLMTSLIFALGAIGSYGILYNLLSKDRGPKTEDRDANNDDAEPTVHRPPSTVHALALFAPLFLLLVSNFGALLEILHQGGLFWAKDPATGEYSSRLWTWLDLMELSQPPMLPFHFLPLDRYLWWWRSSRIIQDYNMVGTWTGDVIDEFPFFSFLLGDLHPHVLAIPFSLLAIAVSLNLFLGGWRGQINLPWGMRLHVNYTGFFFSALVIGGLAFLNTWDILIAATLIVGSYIFWRANEDGWNWERLEEGFMLGLPLGVAALLLYLPFYLGFSSQAGGILPNFMYPTRGTHLWVMWGTLLIPIFAYLIYLWRGKKNQPNWKLAFSLGLGFTFFLFLLTFFVGWIGSLIEKDFVLWFLDAQGMSASQFLAATSQRRLSHIASLITLLAVLISALAHLLPLRTIPAIEHVATVNPKSQIANQFVFLLLILGAILVLAPEFVYLRDQFGYRINTIFKFYYQAWMLWSLAAAFGTAYLIQNLRGVKNTLFSVLISLVIFAGLLYPVLSLLTKTNNFKPYYGFTLDDFDRVARENPDEAAAIEFLHTAPDGVIAEAIGGSYTGYARISTYTGLQTVLGWPGHEDQWRGGYAPQGSRSDDIIKLYTTTRWEEAQSIIDQYNIRYIYVGTLEYSSMAVREDKFRIHLKPIFQQGSVVIYEVP
jgi:YYY domain-containing protein